MITGRLARLGLRARPCFLRGTCVRALSTTALPALGSRRLHSVQSVRHFSSDSDAETHQFKAETKKLLNIVAHSLYTDKEVFIRELISNASDALEKLRFLQATAQVSSVRDEDVPLMIRISTDMNNRTITFEDTGIGMSKEEMMENLGVIARSGSLAFLEDPSINAKDKANAIIGQFGVGFYSSFVVSDKVKVYSRSFDAEKGATGWEWESDGAGSYSIKACPDLPRGTRIELHLKPECVEFCNLSTVKACAQKFSSFISFPLMIKGEDGQDAELNKQEALWLKTSATEDEHRNFYRFLGNTAYGEPMYTFMFHTDAPLSIKSVFYIPEDAPNRMFQTNKEVGVALHSRRVLVKKNAEEIVPKWLFWVKGVVDCDDMPLNVSRENMQDSRLMEKLSMAVVRRILKFLDDQAKADPVKFNKFYKGYAFYLKEGMLEDIHLGNKHKDYIAKLLRFECNSKAAKEVVSLDEYIEAMKPGQQNIYFFVASDRQMAMTSPYMEQFTKKKRNVLLMYEEIDEFVAMNCGTYKGKKFVAIDSPEEDFEPLLEGESGAEEAADAEKGRDERPRLGAGEQHELESFVKGVMGEKVKEIKFTDRLTNSPAVVTGFISPALRKMMKATMRGSGVDEMGGGMGMGMDLPCNLELNPSHPLVTALYHLKDADPETSRLLVEQLYDNACVAAGIMDDPRSMLERLNKILEVSAQFAYHHNRAAAKDGSEGAGEGETQTARAAGASL